MAVKRRQELVCDRCGKAGARVVRTTETYGEGRSLFVIERIPMVRCPHCRERYYTAETLRKVDRIRREKRMRAVDRTVKVARFA